MTAPEIIYVVLVVAFVILGPVWVTSNVIERARARRRASQRQRDGRKLTAQALAMFGPLTDAEAQAFYEYVVTFAVVEDAISTERLQFLVNLSRRAARRVLPSDPHDLSS